MHTCNALTLVATYDNLHISTTTVNDLSFQLRKTENTANAFTGTNTHKLPNEFYPQASAPISQWIKPAKTRIQLQFKGIIDLDDKSDSSQFSI